MQGAATLRQFIASRKVLRWLLCWLSFFASLNVSLEATESLLILQQDFAVAPICYFLQLFWTLAGYIKSNLVLLQRKLLPEYLLNWWPSSYSAGCWSRCPSLWSNEYSLSRKVISIEREAKTTFIQMNTCGVWFESQWRRPFWIFRSKLKKGRKINQNWDTFSCSSVIPKWSCLLLTEPCSYTRHNHHDWLSQEAAGLMLERLADLNE